MSATWSLDLEGGRSRDPTSVREGNEAFSIRVWKSLLNRHILKTLRGNQGKQKKWQYLLTVSLSCYIYILSSMELGWVRLKSDSPFGPLIYEISVIDPLHRYEHSSVIINSKTIVIIYRDKITIIKSHTVRSYIDWRDERVQHRRWTSKADREIPHRLERETKHSL